MGTKKPETLLDDYATLQHELCGLTSAYNAERDALMDRIDPEVRAELEHLETERDAALAQVRAQLDPLVARIKSAVTPLGKSVKGAAFQAVYTPGQPRWNNAMLEGYAMGQPEILKARTYGEPSVSLRPVKPQTTEGK